MSLLLTALAQNENKHYQAGLRAHSFQDWTGNLLRLRDINVAKRIGLLNSPRAPMESGWPLLTITARRLNPSNERLCTLARVFLTLYSRVGTTRKAEWSRLDDSPVHL